MPVKTSKCLYPKCGNSGDHSRGLCRNCYQRAAALVHLGKTTWDELEAHGKILKSKRTRGMSSHRDVWFLGKK
jgi:hypothetical protein